ncbi:protein translocase subunit SecF [Afifella aestuarii]|uniref:protein translocase subunit SecF n=1 Tax=Afifella aestuarii TaxID=1909496 RepID=UPI000FE3CAE0|nr:protein translocase subunit SecF [Afifella aestuarii]
MPFRIVPDETTIPFMRFARWGFPASVVAMVVSLVLFFVVGLNLGIDFKGGTLIEVQSQSGAVDIGAVRQTLQPLELGDFEVQGFGSGNEAIIRIATQPGGDEAQQAAVQKVQNALGFDAYNYRRVEVVGPRVSGELAETGTIAVLVTLVGVLLYIWFRFEWQFAIGAIASLLHDVVLTIGFFTITQIEFNLSSIAAILTIVGYSLNDTVVIFDRVREMLRKFKQTPIRGIIDLSVNQTLSRTLLTSLTTLIALAALFFFGGAVIRSFTAAMIWGVFIGTYSTVFIAAPMLIFFNLRPEKVAPPETAKKPATS